MPFKSKAQRRKFAQLLVEGKITDEQYEEWNRSTGGKALPERVGGTATAKRATRKRTVTKRPPNKRPAKKRAPASSARKSSTRAASKPRGTSKRPARGTSVKRRR